MESRFYYIRTCIKNCDMVFFAYLLFVTVYLGIQMFQGLSFLDIGFYMSGYQYFNEEPIVSYYLGQWLMTFMTMSALCKTFAINSYVGLRVMHLLFVVLSQTVIYFYLKRYIRKRFIIIGMFFATLSHFGGYTEINYNDFSIGWLTLAILAYHYGLTCRKLMFIMLSGVCAGTAVFFRFTNLTFVGLPFLAIFISWRWVTGISVKEQLIHFFIGVVIGCLVTMMVIHIAGMTDILVMTVNDIIGISKNPDDPHNITNITVNFYRILKDELKGGAVTVIIAAVTMLIFINARHFKKPLLMVMAIITIINVYYWEPSANITVGICLAAIFPALFGKHIDKDIIYIFLLSLYIPIMFPLGSNAQVEFFGKDVTFLTTPLALSIIFKSGQCFTPTIRSAYMKSLALVYTSICVAFVFTNIKRPMMEEGNRLQCRYTIDSPLARGILTTQENADTHNYIMEKVKSLVPADSYMICNFSIPVIGMLECKPYAVFSTVFTSNSMNRQYIATAYRHTGSLPYLLTDKQKENEKDRYVELCLTDIREYRILWQDERFVLKAPGHANN